jgi:3-oxoacyl-[acyl-carrier protein] reductase
MAAGGPGSGRLAGKVCIVTGAAQGIGEHYARRLAAEGACVTIVDLTRMEQADQVASGITSAGGRALAVKADVRSAENMTEMVARTVDQFGRVDCLVNNAALYQDRANATWQDYLDVNVMGIVNAANAVVPLFWEQRSGSIINISSIAAQLGPTELMGAAPDPEGPAPVLEAGGYGMSKWMVIYLTRLMAKQLGPRGIRVNAVAPGTTMSPATISSPLATEAQLAKMRQAAALKDVVEPEEMTGVVLFLASDDSRKMTGQTLVNDAGTWFAA